ncbi:MAG: VanW family protein [Lachnospiraceae bacterium]
MIAPWTLPVNAENGYELAGAYENGTTVESYGGGVCQVSTTLYNAVIRAELDITERSAHSMLVTYVEPSMDAAIASEFKGSEI